MCLTFDKLGVGSLLLPGLHLRPVRPAPGSADHPLALHAPEKGADKIGTNLIFCVVSILIGLSRNLLRIGKFKAIYFIFMIFSKIFSVSGSGSIRNNYRSRSTVKFYLSN